MSQLTDLEKDALHIQSMVSSCIGAVDQEQIERSISEKISKKEKELDAKRLEKLEQKKSTLLQKLSKLSEKRDSGNFTQLQISQLEDKYSGLKKQYNALRQEEKTLKDLFNNSDESDDQLSINLDHSIATAPKSHKNIIQWHATASSSSSSPRKNTSRKKNLHPSSETKKRKSNASHTNKSDLNDAFHSPNAVEVSNGIKYRSLNKRSKASPLKKNKANTKSTKYGPHMENSSSSEMEVDTPSEEEQDILMEENEDEEMSLMKEEDDDDHYNDNNNKNEDEEGEEGDEGESEEENDDYDDGNESSISEENHVRLGLKHQTNKEYAVTLDDGDEALYQKRLASWAKQNYEARMKNSSLFSASETEAKSVININDEIYLPGSLPDYHVKDGFFIPGSIHADLFKYQLTCLQWLYELHCQKVGGIIGDEMGLGKTIQAIAFLASLKRSKRLDGPVLIVCPATLMSQWVREIHDWFPPFRCIILHKSGAGFSPKQIQKHQKASTSQTSSQLSMKISKGLVDKVSKDGHILVTTYSGLQKNSKLLQPVKWDYVVLDEGHKLKNPDASITILCKRLRTPHRIILTGTPIQNNLTELWSLFDFIYPGRLGTLPVFQSEFAVPINLGGYANASTLQITCAYKCARALRSIIQPYMLRRMKADVAQDLPKKSEQVLFCKITPAQRALYESFIKSKDVNNILEGHLHPLFGIDALRKICNHPCLFSPSASTAPETSGKMIVLKEILQFWKSGHHKVLVFSQTRKMLDLLENAVKEMGFVYKRMDGMTPVKQRGDLVDEFNTNKNIFIFLLTTKVGGLGVNLTGADRVVIFDPDWNPSTDMQARERAWRLGQLRPVIIYRLIVSGTIEEKIYQRQIFKTFLSNKVLKDPKQRRFFRLNDLKDLFSLPKETQSENKTETVGIFEEMSSKLDDDSLIADIEGVSKLEAMQKTTPMYPNEGPEASMLDKLIQRGVDSSLQHDSALENVKPEHLIMEQYADKILQSSLAALKASRAQLRSYSISAPTWTGHLGLAGKPSNPSSSSALLQKLKDPEPSSNTTSLGVELRDFISKQGGKVKSSELVQSFRSQLKKGYALVFKKLLNEIAHFEKEGNIGWWRLKEQYCFS